MINLFARAADAPQAALRLDSGVTDPATSLVRTGLRFFPPAKRAVKAGLDQLGIPAGVLSYVNYPTHFDSTNAAGGAGGLGDLGAAAGVLRRPRLGLLGAHPRSRPLQGPLA